MLGLLKELSVYKEMNEDYKAGPEDRIETEAYEERERRRHQISHEMQQLAAKCKSEAAGACEGSKESSDTAAGFEAALDDQS